VRRAKLRPSSPVADKTALNLEVRLADQHPRKITPSHLIGASRRIKKARGPSLFSSKCNATESASRSERHTGKPRQTAPNSPQIVFPLIILPIRPSSPPRGARRRHASTAKELSDVLSRASTFPVHELLESKVGPRLEGIRTRVQARPCSDNVIVTASTRIRPGRPKPATPSLSDPGKTPPTGNIQIMRCGRPSRNPRNGVQTRAPTSSSRRQPRTNGRMVVIE